MNDGDMLALVAKMEMKIATKTFLEYVKVCFIL